MVASPKSPLSTVREVCLEYLDRSAEPVNTFARRLILKFIAAKGEIKVQDLKQDDLRDWIEGRWKANWAKRLIANHIKRAFRWAQYQGLIGFHPWSWSCLDRPPGYFTAVIEDPTPERAAEIERELCELLSD